MFTAVAALCAADSLDAQRPGAGAAADSAMAPLAWLVFEGIGRLPSADGTTWRKMLEMKLRRVAASR